VAASTGLEPQVELAAIAETPEDATAEHEVPRAAAVAPGGTGEALYAEPAASAEMPAAVAAPSAEKSAQAPAVLPEPSGGSLEKPPIKLPFRSQFDQNPPRIRIRIRPVTGLSFLRAQLGLNGPSKRRIAIAASGFAVIALMFVWWSTTHQRPKDVPGNPPVQVEWGNQAPAALVPGSAAVRGGKLPTRPTAGPPDRELSTLRNSVVSAIRLKDWSKAGWLIDDLLAKFPADAQAQEWRKLLSEERESELFDKLNPEQMEPNGPVLARAEQLLQQGDYPAAITSFQRVLASDPGNTRAQNGLKQATDAKATEDRVFGGGR
jgi:hypothetical protein